jgi:hypothetical protein
MLPENQFNIPINIYWRLTSGVRHLSKVTDIERESLEAHVELCAERYDRMAEKMAEKMGKLEERMDTIETTLEEIKIILTDKETKVYRKLISIGIATIGTLSTTVIGMIIYIVRFKAGL